jgi:phosphoesterase RecJ-like protein
MMFESILSFFDRHQSFIVTTHDSPDADGIASQLLVSFILRKTGKAFYLINSDPVPERIKFMDPDSLIETWDTEKHSHLAKDSAFLILDTSEEFHIGSMRKILKDVRETFIIDHHEPGFRNKFDGALDTAAASTTELVVELADLMGLVLDEQTATAAYTGIVHDTGFFAYQKTSLRTFKAAIKTIEWGAVPNNVYKQLMETASTSAILLQKQALSHLEFHAGNKIAVLFLYKEDMQISGAAFEDADNIVNIPLRAKEVEVSILLKERAAGDIRCSLRSKGNVNVSEIAQNFGGGGHVAAAGFKSSKKSMEEIFKKLLSVVESRLDTC